MGRATIESRVHEFHLEWAELTSIMNIDKYTLLMEQSLDRPLFQVRPRLRLAWHSGLI